MDKIELTCDNLGKKYEDKIIFRNLSLKLANKSSLVVTGKNGSGKSTLVKILANVIKESMGSYIIRINEKEIPRENFFQITGFLSSYLNLYDELTGYENLEFFYTLKFRNKISKTSLEEKIKFILEEVNLYPRRNDFMKNYSSGMRQRLKLAFAVINEPLLLLLDEPRTNLDNEGIDVVYKFANRQRENGILIIATNEIEDTILCEEKINIEDFKNN
ncbi:MAG TPA: ATP-binding cassette domain-containing protein [Ignavibacteria bacterium]